MIRLSYFEPFQSKAAWHEDQLTRAFLVLIRFVPLVHARFLALIREEQERVGCEELLSPVTVVAEKVVSIDTQTSRIRQDQGRLLSILMSDEQWTKEHNVQASERGARYDGVLAYTASKKPLARSEPDWLIIVENKPSERNVWPDQINPAYHSLPPEHGIEIEPKLIALSWRSVIRDLRGLLEQGLAGRTERMLVEDFLQYVADHYSYLLPFDRVADCDGDEFLLQKRCDKILESVVRSDVSTPTTEPIQGGCLEVGVPSTRFVWLNPNRQADGSQYIQLSLYPGDTIAQARAFYSQVDPASVDSLRELNWDVQANLHFAYMATNLYWCSVAPDVRQYLEFWMANQDRIRQEQRDPERGFLPLFESLCQDGLVGEHELPDFQKQTTQTRRNAINICPGIALSYRWTLDKAVDLDQRGELESEVIKRVRQALATFGESL